MYQIGRRLLYMLLIPVVAFAQVPATDPNCESNAAGAASPLLKKNAADIWHATCEQKLKDNKCEEFFSQKANEHLATYRANCSAEKDRLFSMNPLPRFDALKGCAVGGTVGAAEALLGILMLPAGAAMALSASAQSGRELKNKREAFYQSCSQDPECIATIYQQQYGRRPDNQVIARYQNSPAPTRVLAQLHAHAQDTAFREKRIEVAKIMAETKDPNEAQKKIAQLIPHYQTRQIENALELIEKKAKEKFQKYECVNRELQSEMACYALASILTPSLSLAKASRALRAFSKEAPPMARASGPPGREIRATASDIGKLDNHAESGKLEAKSAELMKSLEPDRSLTVMTELKDSTTQSTRMTREQALRLADDPKVSKITVASVEARTPPRLAAAEARKIDAEVNQTLTTQSPDTLQTVVIQFKSGEVAKYRGNRDMLMNLAKDPDVDKILPGHGAPDWLPESSTVARTERTPDKNKIAELQSEMRSGPMPQTRKGSEFGDSAIYHGTVQENVSSVQGGVKNVGTGFGGRGLYLARESERRLAENYADFAKEAAVNRVSNVRANVNPNEIDRTPVVMKGRLNPDKEFKVGVFEVGRDIFEPDLKRGRLPPDWDKDPRLRQLLEKEFDILEVKNASKNGLNLDSNSFYVVHERAGPNAVLWDKVEPAKLPSARKAPPAAQAVNEANVERAVNTWYNSGSPSRVYLPRMNAAERQTYGSYVIEREMTPQQSTAFQEAVGRFKSSESTYWKSQSDMTTFQQQQSQSLKRAGFTDQQIKDLFESGAITGTRPAGSR